MSVQTLMFENHLLLRKKLASNLEEKVVTICTE